MKRILTLLVLFSLLGAQVTAQQGRLDVTTFVVLGEGLAAGMADFSLKDVYQDKNFAAQMARQMKTIMPQPLIQPPGIGDPPGFTPLPSNYPKPLQTTLRESGPNLFVFNLSVPGLKTAEAVGRRPAPPLIQQNDSLQTVINFILGFPSLAIGTTPLWSQLEYARQMRPTIVLVALGYAEALDAAVKGNAALVPDVATFRTSYATIVRAMRDTQADVIVLTIPDPTQTAYFSTVDAATALLGAPASVINGLYTLVSGDLLTVHGLVEIGNQLLIRSVKPLSAGMVLRASVANDIRARVTALNAEISSQAQANGAVVYDLNAFLTGVKRNGVTVGQTRLSGDYLGGFYSLDGYFPGFVGHALIANELLSLMNRTYGSSFAPVSVEPLVPVDPAGRNIFSARRPYTVQELEGFIPNLRELLPSKDRRK